MRSHAWMRAAATAALAGVVAGCGGGAREVRINVRTTLPEELTRFVEAEFEADNPAIDVRFSRTNATASLGELSGAVSSAAPFDVWWGAPAISLEQATRADLLMLSRPSWLESSTSVGSFSSDFWQPLLETPFVIAFNRDSVPLARAPTDWIDVFHARWTEEVVALDPVRSEEGAAFVGTKLLESIRQYGDPLPGFDWLARLDTQVRRYVSDSREAIDMLQAGSVRLGILPRADVEAARSRGIAVLHYRLPESPGPALLLGVAIVARPTASVDGARTGSTPEADATLDAARRFVEYVGSRAVATESWRLTHWQPTRDADAPDLPRDLELGGRWTPVPVAIDTLASEVGRWVDRWELQLRRR